MAVSTLATAQTQSNSPVIQEHQPVPGALGPVGQPLREETFSAVHLEVPAATAKAVPPGSYVSPWLMDIVKLARARIDDTVMVTFIDSAGTFNLDVDQIIYLRDLGLSGEVIAIMIQHDAEITSGLRQIPAAASASPSTLHFTFARGESPVVPIPPASAPPFGISNPTAAPVEKSSSSILSTPATFDTAILESDALDVPATAAARMQTRVLPLPQTISPVRQPYAVQLIEPFIIVRGQARTPNLTVIEMLP